MVWVIFASPLYKPTLCRVDQKHVKCYKNRKVFMSIYAPSLKPAIQQIFFKKF